MKFGWTGANIESALAESIKLMDMVPMLDTLNSKIIEDEDNLHSNILHADSSDVSRNNLIAYAPPLSITPTLSFTHILSVQSRLVNAATMKLFFHELKVREHLSLLWQYFLFGDGVFVSRLSHALFDDDLESADRREGTVTGGTMGLKLGSRDSWPPASSELRLALMGILAECYQSNESEQFRDEGEEYKKDDLPGGLSFMVRDMTEEELDRCMNPDSIEAMDFLRLQYRPPSPLDAIITLNTLHKYDKLFKLLLRVIRMLYAVNQLFHDMTSRTSVWKVQDPIAQEFRIEAHHFISSLCKYFFEAGINNIWKRFGNKMNEMESQLNSDECHESLGQFLEFHERILDRMLFATLSRKRQQPIMKLVEEIFSIVLTFVRYARARSTGNSWFHERNNRNKEEKEQSEADFVKKLYSRFRKRVAIFISVCRGLNDKRGYGEGKGPVISSVSVDMGSFMVSDAEEGGMLGQLLIKLEMTGYYLKKEETQKHL